MLSLSIFMGYAIIGISGAAVVRWINMVWLPYSLEPLGWQCYSAMLRKTEIGQSSVPNG